MANKDSPNAYNCSRALIKVSAGGRSIKSNPSRSFIPSDFSIRTTFPMFVRWISGTVLASSCSINSSRQYVVIVVVIIMIFVSGDGNSE